MYVQYVRMKPITRISIALAKKGFVSSTNDCIGVNMMDFYGAQNVTWTFLAVSVCRVWIIKIEREECRGISIMALKTQSKYTFFPLGI